MSNNRFYYYDHEACSFVEVRPPARRITRKLLGIVAGALIGAGVAAWGLTQMVGTPQELALQAENEALRNQLSLVERRMHDYSTKIEEFSRSDQTLYRTLLEADPISADVREMGIGGVDSYERFNRFSTSTATILRRTSQELDKMERQIALQSASYRELMQLAVARREAWAEMPAIIPANGPLVSGYGMRRHPILRINKMHLGIDVLVPTGSPVVATGDGVIKETGVSATYGKHVVVNHPETGYSTLYAHLSEIPKEIRRGKRVKRGDQIGLSGNTGRSTGPHLHYEVRDAKGRTLNPVDFFFLSVTPVEYEEMLAAAQQSGVALD